MSCFCSHLINNNKKKIIAQNSFMRKQLLFFCYRDSQFLEQLEKMEDLRLGSRDFQCSLSGSNGPGVGQSTRVRRA